MTVDVVHGQNLGLWGEQVDHQTNVRKSAIASQTNTLRTPYRLPASAVKSTITIQGRIRGIQLARGSS